MRVCKYQLGPDDKQTVTMPKGASIVKIAMQHSVLTLWVIVDPDEELSERSFTIVATGADIPTAYWLYHGTFFQGPFAWHLFEAR